jgi:peptidoglycan/LPS O-acetylase OafA/YrhL
VSTTVPRDLDLSSALPPDPALPSPPDDREKYGYLGRQHRWLPWLQAASFTLIAGSVARFAVGDLRLLLFLVPMSLYAVTMVVSLLSSSRGRRISRASHTALVSTWRPSTAPSVDVFLPSAGEPLELLANTFSHVRRLDWDGPLTVWVLDDSDRSEVAELALLHGFEYRTRPDRGFLKKAGNLKFGYEQSDGDLIAIFDADFVPRPDYLRELVPYFEDPAVGIVQSPQYFDTRTPGMHWLQRTAGATQELFYRWIQPARDRSQAAICVGTCAVYRRAGLVRAGGFAQIGHSEDVHTGVKLLKVGFRVQYVPVLVSKGVCPDTLSGFLNQQYRWCTGSMSLLADRSFHEAPIIRTRQRLCFWAGFLYYISTAVNALVAPLPGIAMLWLLPDWIEPMNSVWLLGALALWFVVLPLVMHCRWRVDVVRVQHLYSFAHLVAIVHVLLGRTREWVATGAANRRSTPLAVSISRYLKGYVAITQGLIWVGLVHGTLTYGIGDFWVMLLFGLLGAYLQLPILFLPLAAPRAPLGARTQTLLRDPLLGLRRLLRFPAPAMASGSLLDVLGPVRASVPAGGATAARVASRTSSGRAPLTAGTRTPSAPAVLPPLTAPGSAELAAAPGPRRFRPDIQGLRAVAVLLVVLYHAHLPGVRGGYVGVDVFFVISGFLITGQLLREVERHGRISFLGFYGGRMRRLLPPAALVVVLTVVATRLVDSVLHVRSVALDAVFTTFYAMNYRLAALGVDYQNASGPVSPLQHMWSLSVEEQFYLVWPLLIAGCAWLGRGRRRELLVVVLGAGTAVSLYLAVTLTAANPPFSYFGLHTRAWELALGGLVAVAAGHLARLPRVVAVAASWCGVSAVVVSGLVYTDSTAFPGTAALVPTVAAAAVIAAGCRQHAGGAERLLAWRPMQGIGAVSYGWYLWHWPLLVLTPLAAGYELTWPYQVEIVALGLWFAILTYYLVEKPSLRSRLRRPFWLVGGAGLSVSVAATSLALIATLPSMVGAGAAAVAVDLDKADNAAVQSSVLDGLSVMVAPSNLRPTVAEAAKDQPASSKDGCHANYLQTLQPDCVYGDPHGSRTLVLFGDSHAQQWLPALDAEGQKLGWKVVAWTKAACPVAETKVTNSALGRDFTECYSWRENTKIRIERLDPDLVVVSQSDTVPGTQVTNAAWGDATSRSLLSFKKVGIPVAYVLDTPYLNASAPDCVAAHLGNVGACNIPRTDVAPYGGRRAALSTALTAVKVTSVDPTPWFCTNASCPVVVGDLLVYRDASHMSTPYSRWLAPMTRPFFVERDR